ncbi:succinylglutamate-semialdehyde dehydrogenase [Marinobacterium sp. MBR-109]|jgi:succinylglutamic semialdehyde dehydrogenase|uniref:succinylglutamate-semialdehyde dehydrogenase n=1 Tax=Marinobacterium sp. MBR-109 TaxID=3156462 RepID=UPI00339996CA
MLDLLINGSWVTGEGSPLVSTNPVNGERLWSGQSASLEQVERALSAARRAAPNWVGLGFDLRRQLVERYSELLQQEAEPMAVCIAEETGKPLWEARTEVTSMVGKTALSIRAFNERTGSRITEQDGVRMALRHKPHGVLAVFGPYNFPGHLPNGHIVPALLAGNTLLFKPSEQTPLVSRHMVELWQRAGLPHGVLNLLQGGAEVGQALAASEQLDGICFTGSSATGERLQQQFGNRPGKLLALEMGGNNPLLLRPVDNIEAALFCVIQSAFLSGGQRCSCARRLLIPVGNWGDEFINRLAEAVGRLKVDNPFADPQPFMGSLISSAAVGNLLAAQQRLQLMGAEVVMPMQSVREGSALLTPGLIDVTALGARAPDEEYFGPMLQLIRYRDFDQAITLANRTRYGLSAGLISDSEAEFDHFHCHIRAGVVNWNRPLTGASGALPFGGIGASGNHRPGAWYAADYCAYPVAGLESARLELPQSLPPGMVLGAKG